jgi:hypothetical protein
MPKGILSRLIVEMHEYIQDGVVWRTGVLLEKDGAVAEVMETYAKNEITIHVKGNNPESLRAVVMHEIDEINRSFQHLKVEKLVPCNCGGCVEKATPHFFKESQLLERKSYGKHEIECGQPPYNQADVLSLLSSVRLHNESEFDHFFGKKGDKPASSAATEQKSKVKKLILTNKLKKAIEILLGIAARRKDADFESLVILQSGKLEDYEAKRLMGTITTENGEVILSTLRANLLKLCDEI